MQDFDRQLSMLAEAYQDSLLKICFIYLRDPYLAEDAVQETFLKAYKALPDFRRESSPKTWLTRIAVNTCRDMRRKAWFQHIRQCEFPERTAADSPDATDEVITVSAEIARLPEKLRIAVLLYYYQDMTVEEIAQTLGVSQPSVSQRLKKAKEKLRTALKGEYFNE